MDTSNADPASGMEESALLQPLSAFLSTSLARPVTVAALRRFAVGFSWITFGFSIDAPGIDGITRLILRLGPSYGLFAPYSAAPQYFSLKAIEGTGVPAPRAFFWSDDPAILGAPFFISEWVDGTAPIPWGASDDLAGARRQELGEQFIDALAHLHNVDGSTSELAAWSPGVTHASASALQIESWERDYTRWAMRPHPMLKLAFHWLRDHQPVAPRVSIIHGDYRLGNFLEVNSRITAILDWELVHLGDPHEDLAWVCLPQYRGGTSLMCKLLPRDELYRRYEAITGLEVNETSMTFYGIFSLVKLAVTHIAAVSAFERQGFRDMRMPAMGTQIAPVLRQLEKALFVSP